LKAGKPSPVVKHQHDTEDTNPMNISEEKLKEFEDKFGGHMFQPLTPTQLKGGAIIKAWIKDAFQTIEEQGYERGIKEGKNIAWETHPDQSHNEAYLDGRNTERELWESELYKRDQAREEIIKKVKAKAVAEAIEQTRKEDLETIKELLARRNMPGENPYPEYDRGIDDAIESIKNKQ
jgi:hypothetical protein